jgi:undecaprenyl-diphosphatase
MDLFINILKSVVYGIVQGITEWLPISSTGHLILMENFMPLTLFTDPAANKEFWDMYKVVIQFGSILAVVLAYWKSLWPWQPNLETKKKRHIYRLWILIIIATIPAGIAGLLLDDLIDNVLSAAWVIAAALIIYGILFIWMENREHHYEIERIGQITPKKALGVGCFQMLSLIPGTSRSGSTILGATLLGFDRKTAARFSFFMAIPVMLGASLLKIIKADITYTAAGVVVLLVGMAVAFVVSLIVIQKLMEYIRRHDFKIFGYYRIVLGVIVLIFSLLGFLH